MQCGKLEPLEAFDGAKRSCRVQLARRRVQKTEQKPGSAAKVGRQRAATSRSLSASDSESLPFTGENTQEVLTITLESTGTTAADTPSQQTENTQEPSVDNDFARMLELQKQRLALLERQVEPLHQQKALQAQLLTQQQQQQQQVPFAGQVSGPLLGSWCPNLNAQELTYVPITAGPCALPHNGLGQPGLGCTPTCVPAGGSSTAGTQCNSHWAATGFACVGPCHGSAHVCPPARQLSSSASNACHYAPVDTAAVAKSGSVFMPAACPSTTFTSSSMHTGMHGQSAAGDGVLPQVAQPTLTSQVHWDSAITCGAHHTEATPSRPITLGLARPVTTMECDTQQFSAGIMAARMSASRSTPSLSGLSQHQVPVDAVPPPLHVEGCMWPAAKTCPLPSVAAAVPATAGVTSAEAQQSFLLLLGGENTQDDTHIFSSVDAELMDCVDSDTLAGEPRSKYTVWLCLPPKFRTLQHTQLQCRTAPCIFFVSVVCRQSLTSCAVVPGLQVSRKIAGSPHA